MSAPLLLFTCSDTTVSTFFNLEEWFRDPIANTPFEIAHGMSPWSLTKIDTLYNNAMNHACIGEQQLRHRYCAERGSWHLPRAQLADQHRRGPCHSHYGHCSGVPANHRNMLNLEQVIRKLPSCGMVKYILGDMFEFIPTAINSNMSTTIDSTMQQLGAFLNQLI